MSDFDHAANAEQLDIALYGKPEIYTPPEVYMSRRTLMAETLALMYPARHGVDRKAEVEELIEFAKSNGSVSAATAAVATATVYAAEQAAELVEQQRIANVIALEDLKQRKYGAYSGPSLIFGLPPTETGNVPVLGEIREGLGLS